MFRDGEMAALLADLDRISALARSGAELRGLDRLRFMAERCRDDATLVLWLSETESRSLPRTNCGRDDWMIPCQGWLRTLWAPIRRQMTCGSPSLTGTPYTKVARPSSAQVISKIPPAPLTPLTRSPLRNPSPLAKSSTNCATAVRKAAF